MEKVLKNNLEQRDKNPIENIPVGSQHILNWIQWENTGAIKKKITHVSTK